MIERIHLKILTAIEQEGSLTAAAESLHLTQSALSHMIKKLDQRLGADIWQKQGRNIELTATGQYLLQSAKRILPQLERVDETLKQMARGERGTLKIGMECHPCYQWLLGVTERYLAEWPEIDVDVIQKFQFGGMAALFNHDIDVLVTPDPLERKGITFTPVFPYEQVLVVSVEHPLAERKHITPADLTEQVLYTYPVETDRLDVFQLFLNPNHCLPKKHKTTEATEIILQMVATNRGVATLPRWLVEQYQSVWPIRAVSLGAKGIHKNIHLGIRDQASCPKYIQALFDIAQSEQ